MSETLYRNRQAARIETRDLRVTVFKEGGHIAEILHKASGVNPLWTPPWPSIEPSTYDEARNPEYGQNAESRLLAGISGHNICLDTFGGPSAEEAAAGLGVHGEAPVASYEIEADGYGLNCRTELPIAGLRFQRRIQLTDEGIVLRISETVENLRACDRPIAWTEHVTLGPPFLEKGVTESRAPGTRSKVLEEDFAGKNGRQKIGAEFDWPNVPLKDGGTEDLRVYTTAAVSGGFTTTLMDPEREQAFFLAYSPKSKLLFGYVWRRSDFPWLGRWEENYGRTAPPWNGKTLTLGMEFGVSPMPESRRKMIDRGSLFGQPGFRWIPARTKVTVDYCAFVTTADRIPETVSWDGEQGITFSS